MWFLHANQLQTFSARGTHTDNLFKATQCMPTSTFLPFLQLIVTGPTGNIIFKNEHCPPSTFIQFNSVSISKERGLPHWYGPGATAHWVRGSQKVPAGIRLPSSFEFLVSEVWWRPLGWQVWTVLPVCYPARKCWYHSYPSFSLQRVA